MNILTVNLLFSTLVFGIAARLYLMPAISRLEARSVVLPILLLHSMRHLGLMFLALGARCFPASLSSSHIPPHWAICSQQCLRSSRFLQSFVHRRSRAPWSAFSMSSERSTWLTLFLAPPSTTPRRIWDPRTGYLPSGFRRSSSLTLLCLSFWVGAGMGRCEQSDGHEGWAPTLIS
jgi:hypothetical protein